MLRYKLLLKEHALEIVLVVIAISMVVVAAMQYADAINMIRSLK